MISEDRLRRFPLPMVYRAQRLERWTEIQIYRKIRKIGTLSPTGRQLIRELKSVAQELDELQQEIERALQEMQEAALSLLDDYAREEYEEQTDIYDLLQLPAVPFAENAEVMRLVESVGQVTAGEFHNLSGTTGFVRPDGQWEPLAQFYQDTIDDAVLHVRKGTTDYHKAMRGAVKAMADSGLSYGVNRDGTAVVDYPSGYHRRLDSSLKNAFSGAQQRLSLEQSNIIGTQTGADGMEVSWHSGFRPTHNFGGLQFPMAQFLTEIQPLMDEPNCYHRAYPILFGVSRPAYSPSDLDALNAQEDKRCAFEGKWYDGYQARQRQRQLETAIRREKDRAVAFAESGDAQAEAVALGKAAALTAKYKAFSEAMDLQPDAMRITVAGFSRSQAARMGWLERKPAAPA